MSARPRGRARGGKHGAEPRSRIRLREIQVMELMLEGRTQHQIAAAVGLSQRRVRTIPRESAQIRPVLSCTTCDPQIFRLN